MADPNGKKIHTWQFYKDNEHVDVIVRMKGSSSIMFTAECPRFDLIWKDSDLNALRNTVDREIKAHVSVVYKPMLLVEYVIKPDNRYGRILDTLLADDKGEVSYGEIDQIVRLEVTRLLIAKGDEKDRLGRPRYLSKRHLTDGSQQFWMPHELEPDEEKENHRILLDDTLENQIALQEVLDGIERLRGKLASLLDPKMIKKTIKMINASGMKLLPAQTEVENGK